MAIFEDDIHIVPGFVWRCSIVDSLLHSTLECLFSDTNCRNDLLLHFLNFTNTKVRPVPPINVTMLGRFTSNTTVGQIVEKNFVNEWMPSVSHINYFQICAPRTCTYTYIQRANLLYAVTTLAAVFGGLIYFLRFVAPLVIKIVTRRRRHSSSADRNQGEFHPFVLISTQCLFQII